MSRHGGDPQALELRRKAWAKQAPSYDKRISFFERKVFGEQHRAWACSQATGRTLEVAIGTGLNLAHYPDQVSLTGIDLSSEMLDIARKRASDLRREVELMVADAQALDLAEESFDTVVCTYSLCNVPDDAGVISEMQRVLKPGGRLILVDHIRSSVRAVYWFQKILEFFSLRTEGEHLTRRPSLLVKAAGFEIDQRERMRWGIVERLTARKTRSQGVSTAYER